MQKSRKKKKAQKKHGQTKPTPKSRLEKATTAYFSSLSGEALKEENRLGAALAKSSAQVDFDAE
jgi:hypothetical protein